jgi:hypothetical protein
MPTRVRLQRNAAMSSGMDCAVRAAMCVSGTAWAQLSSSHRERYARATSPGTRTAAVRSGCGPLPGRPCLRTRFEARTILSALGRPLLVRAASEARYDRGVGGPGGSGQAR